MSLRPSTTLWSTLALAHLAAPSAAQSHVERTEANTVLSHPCPVEKAAFGESTCVLQMDGVGDPDVAVGAYGQGAVFVFHGATPGHDTFAQYRVYDSNGPVLCPVQPRGDRFGYDVTSGQLDGDAPDELVVGAPWAEDGAMTEAGLVYVVGGITHSIPMPLASATPQAGAHLGWSVTVGDFDGDGQQDLAAGAPDADVGGLMAGKVHVFFGPFDAGAAGELVIDNPQPVLHGYFGGHLATGDGNGDGVDDLCVAAIGNTAGGLPKAGQVFVFPGPLDPLNHVVVEDPAKDPNDLPAPRYGMHIQAREDWLLVGANRKDWVGVHDAGMGFSARWPGYQVNLHPYPDPRTSDHFGFRCAVANVIGDPALDLTFVLMGYPKNPDPNPRALVTWDGNAILGPPTSMRVMMAGSENRFGNGLSYGQVAPGGYEELVVGDPTFDRPFQGPNDDAGRVVVYFYD